MISFSLNQWRDFFSKLFRLSAEETKKCHMDFRKWLFSVILSYFVLPLILALILLKVFGYFYLVKKLANFFIIDSEKKIIVLQAGFILFVILIPIKEKLFNKNVSKGEREMIKVCGYSENDEAKWHDAKIIANKAIKGYKMRFYLIWVFWFLLYITLFLQKENLPGISDNIFNFLINLFNNATTLIFILCYLILYKITISDNRTGVTETPNWIPWFTIFLVITLLDAIIGGNSPVKIPLGDNKTFDISIFKLISGIVSGIVMALFIGRFDSKFINAPAFILVSLYAYAVIQTFFWGMNVYIIVFALFSKILLFLFMYWLFISGRLLFYFIRIRKLHYNVEGEWQQFSCLLYESLNDGSSADSKDEITGTRNSQPLAENVTKT